MQNRFHHFFKIDYDTFGSKDPITSIEINKWDKGFSLLMLNTSKIFFYNWQVILIFKNWLNSISNRANFLPYLVQYPTRKCVFWAFKKASFQHGKSSFRHQQRIPVYYRFSMHA